MFTPWFWAAACLAAADWAAVNSPRRMAHAVRWFTKPAVMLALLAWFSQVGGWRAPLAWFGAGLALSLLGDVLLHMPEHYFLGGVAAFFAAHLCYIAGFLHGPLPELRLWLLPVLPAAVSFALLVGRIRQGLSERGQAGLFGPVVVYSLALGAMWAVALCTQLRADWQPLAAFLCSLGGSLFYLSDSLLAYSRFVRPIPRGDLLVMTSYHAAQALLTAGVLLQYA